MIEINDVVQFVGRHEKGSVVGAIGANTPIRIFAGLGQTRDVVAYPASSTVARVDAALGMVTFEVLQQSAEVLISRQSVGVVCTGCGSDIITPLIVPPCVNTVIQQPALPIDGSWNRLFQSFLAWDNPVRMLLRDFRFWCGQKSRVPQRPIYAMFAQ